MIISWLYAITSYTQKSTLDRHIRSAHENENSDEDYIPTVYENETPTTEIDKKYKCDICVNFHVLLIPSAFQTFPAATINDQTIKLNEAHQHYISWWHLNHQPATTSTTLQWLLFQLHWKQDLR